MLFLTVKEQNIVILIINKFCRLLTVNSSKQSKSQLVRYNVNHFFLNLSTDFFFDYSGLSLGHIIPRISDNAFNYIIGMGTYLYALSIPFLMFGQFILTKIMRPITAAINKNPTKRAPINIVLANVFNTDPTVLIAVVDI